MIARSTLILVTVAVLSLAACADQESDAGADDAFGFKTGNGFKASNGLASVDGVIRTAGLTGQNGAMTSSGLSLWDGLFSECGLSSMTGLMTTDAGRKTVAYLVRCALGPSDQLVKQDHQGVAHFFNGEIGLCPQWLLQPDHHRPTLPAHGVRLHDGVREQGRRPDPDLARLRASQDRLGRRPGVPLAGGHVLRQRHDDGPSTGDRPAQCLLAERLLLCGPRHLRERRRRPPQRVRHQHAVPAVRCGRDVPQQRDRRRRSHQPRQDRPRRLHADLRERRVLRERRADHRLAQQHLPCRGSTPRTGISSPRCTSRCSSAARRSKSPAARRSTAPRSCKMRVPAASTRSSSQSRAPASAPPGRSP